MHLFALALSAFLLAPQEHPAPPDLQPQSFSIDEVIERAVGITSLPDGALVGAGPRWNAHWQGRDVEFSVESQGEDDTPALGLRFEQMRRDGAPSQPGLSSAARVVPDSEGLQRRVSRVAAPGVVEHWIASELGLELAFELDRRPAGHGDLRFALSVETCLSAPLGRGDFGAGLGFTNAQGGGIQIGGVTAVDADGRTAPGWLEWDGAELVLGVPGEFVDACAYPLLVDPVFSGVLTIPGTGYLAKGPVSAWDAKKSVWCVAWRYRLSASKFCYRVQRLKSTGALLGSAQTLVVNSPLGAWAFKGTAYTPRIVSVSGRDTFVVLFATDMPKTGVGSMMYWCPVHAKTGFPGPDFTFFHGSPYRVDSYDLGADSASSSPNFLSVWSAVGLGVHSALSYVSPWGGVEAIGHYAPGIQTLSSRSWPDVDGEHIAVSGTNGTNRVWLVAWVSPVDGTYYPRVSAKAVDSNGTPVSAELNVATYVPYYTVDGVWVAGDGAEFFVGYRVKSGVQSLYYKRCTFAWPGVLATETYGQFLATFLNSTPGLGVQARMSLRRIRDSYVAAWLERKGDSPWTLHAARLSAGVKPAYGTPLALPGYSSEDRYLSIGSQTESRPTPGAADLGMVTVEGTSEVLRTFVKP